MKKNIAFTLLYILTINILNCQEICIYDSFYIRIDNTEDVPTIQSNQNDNSIKLIHKESYITEIFAKYKIYGFDKAFPSSQSEILQKTYSILTSSRGLLKELSEKVSNEIFWFEPNQTNLKIVNFDEEVIQYFKNEALYKIAEFRSISEGCSGGSDCLKITDLKQIFSLYFDENKDFLVLESKKNTVCINSFKIKFKQVFSDSGQIRLIVWQTDSENSCLKSDVNEMCQTERALFETIKLFPLLELDKESFTLTGSTPIFTENIFRFSQESLSLRNENIQEFISIFQNPKTNLLSIKPNLAAVTINEVKIFDFSGREVVFKEDYFNNINLSTLNSGIYFLQIKMANGLQFYKKIVKH
ncbi:T9SS type A sorting domain-containing protein [uncultured Polaribacter sp.]|uniref:T9SS type A sorting domain-containing protein n=1 Tax=uncultured Polaribacter sp. TaxID=174711 RepID=UPI00259B176A|nr:T9SS type A sorting domain-containing protein [uncultured Polaribacter sp.]